MLGTAQFGVLASTSEHQATSLMSACSRPRYGSRHHLAERDSVPDGRWHSRQVDAAPRTMHSGLSVTTDLSGRSRRSSHPRRVRFCLGAADRIFNSTFWEPGRASCFRSAAR
jgi:hypothetical protein